MHRSRIAATAAFVVIFSLIAVIPSGPVRAASAPTNIAAQTRALTSAVHLVHWLGTPVLLDMTVANAAYDIESYNYYCTYGGTSCIPDTFTTEDCRFGYVALDIGQGCAGLNFAKVDAYGLPNGSTSGTPAAMYLECTHFTATGYQDAFVNVYSSAGASTNAVWGGNLGTISGKGTLFYWSQQNPSFATNLDEEENLAQTSSVNASAFDPHGAMNGGSQIGSVTGTQNTNNADDSLNNGALRITIRGEIDYYDIYGQYMYSAPGTIACLAGGTHVHDLANAGRDFNSGAEGEMGWDYMFGGEPPETPSNQPG